MLSYIMSVFIFVLEQKVCKEPENVFLHQHKLGMESVQ